MAAPTFALTPKMQARYDSCPLVQRHANSAGFAAQAQVQVSAELPLTYHLYSEGSARYMCSSVAVRVVVPDYDEGWGFFRVVQVISVPRQYEDDSGGVGQLSDVDFDAAVEAAIAEASATAQAFRNE